MFFHLTSQNHASETPSPIHSEINQSHQAQIIIPCDEPCKEVKLTKTDFFGRAQRLQAAVLGATDGLVFVSFLMITDGSREKDMLISALIGLITGACRKAISEFFSVHAQNNIKVAQMKRAQRADVENKTSDQEEIEPLPSPLKAAGAKALAFVAAGSLPLLAGGFISRPWAGRMVVVCSVTSLALAVVGVIWAVLGGVSIPQSLIRALLGGLA
ncbi:vacuolar iron transporter homolog 2-like [Typha latifolia]|uniref:vacuolar iron transporter homolog 2-like n=1 Tax=Typha latifolia TaxID=4733 RepID=UPI003C2FA936